MTEAPVSLEPTAYELAPVVTLPAGHRVLRGRAAWERVRDTALERGGARARAVIDTYPGVDLPALLNEVRERFLDWRVVDAEDAAALAPDELRALTARAVTEDRVFGVMSHFRLREFYDPGRLERLRRALRRHDGPVLVVGWGAALAVDEPHTLVLADMARWEIQRRQRAGAPNWRVGNDLDDALRKVKRGYFVEWRTADRHKVDLLERIDFVLDTNASVGDAKLITGAALRAGMDIAVAAPFRVVPFFDPGVWGGQWMRRRFGLDADQPNYAWCFDCVPEENSILFGDGVDTIELPALDVVLGRPRELLGERTFARFGAEFPIRFDFLDTVEGGNLSLQVHPLTDYIRDRFGMAYTQDESYYLLDAADDAIVYLGLKTGIDPEAMVADLRRAAAGEAPFDAERYVNAFPARRHDHFAIPAGTVHCSGADSMVLEISATPYIFTFKMWDWGRLGLDGRPRPIHLDHAVANIQWDRDTAWVEQNLVGRVREIDRGPGWREESTGLHEFEFIEVRRHWFSGTVPHDTDGTVNVLNLVEGDHVVVSSPTGSFPPFDVHYAETFIVPAAVGAYTIAPAPGARAAEFATVKAFVRGTGRTRST